MQYARAARQQATARAVSPSFGRYQLGAATNDWNTFYSGGSASYQDAGGLVYCNKDSANRPQCLLNAYTGGKASSGPVADMQRATDVLINQIPVWHNKVGQQANITGPDGTTTTQTVKALPANPIASESGYDGVVGSSTADYVTAALILAGALKAIPDTVAAAFITPTQANYALYSNAIAAYFNDVNTNFDALLADYLERGNVPATTPFDPASVPALAPFVPKPSLLTRNGLMIGAALAMIGITGLASWNAARHKPEMMYDDHVAPSFGRRRKRRNRRRGY